ncbi:hypothetical protein N657DRAFT_499390 [Parathielavia appendiculata]|uniref:C2H2-type domain-containing protein n=1 Tax=Parathielavia appendiculata TaxID=2587402 RepID=A0AAN6TY84_9PEZI|nr:hypothetical protein N657DRAFT_499390 [Parathielavia appendiculata]
MAQHLRFPQQDRYPQFNLGDLSPGSLDSITMPAYGRPASTNLRTFAPYASMPTQAQGTGEIMATLNAFASGHNQQAGTQSQGLHPLSQFMHEQGPWVPPNLVPSRGDTAKGQPAGVSFNQSFANFNGFRSVAPPSEADTVSQSVGGIFSDSGYESMRRSVGNPSNYGDADQGFETQHLISSFQGMASVSSQDGARKREARGQRTSVGQPNAKTMICPGCNALVKTNSELKKHQARHNKPFKCDVSGCPKATEGFSTNNDLERHRRCVHRLRIGSESVYRCDLDQCKDKPKDWPRQDNFRQHLRRKHNLENVDLTPFTFRSSSPPEFSGFRSSEDVATEEGAAMSSDAASQPLWAGLDRTHIDPSNLINRDAGFSQAGNLVPYPGHPPSAEGDFASSRAEESQYLGQDIPNATSLHLDMEPTLSNLSMPRSSQEERASATQSYSGDNQPTCIAPDVLSHGRTGVGSLRSLNSQAQPTEVVDLEVEDSYELPRQEDAKSEQDEVESSVADGMDVDDEPMQDFASEDGADSEDDEALNDVSDIQSNLLRDTGAQYSADDEVHIKPSPSQVQLIVDTPRPVDLDDERQASAIIQSLIKKGKLGEILKKFGYSAPESADVKEEKLPANFSTASDNGRGRVKCEDCHKTFVRRCELKKHMKRHAKPYACTFAKCVKKFGSKNDWKRHENSQHFQLEIWRCAEKAVDRPDQQECGKVCHRRESLKSHLERDHGIQDLGVLDKKLTDCRMGRNFESRFWCGFCQKTIEPTGKGGPAHSERFDHIDDHFNGRGGLPKADIRDWKHVDTDPVESPRSSPDKGASSFRESGRRSPTPSSSVTRSSGSNPRKRVHGRDEDCDASSSRAKRLRNGRASGSKEAFWECCFCRNSVGRVGITDQCVNGNDCDHMRCDNCEVFEGENIVEPEPEVLLQSRQV